MCYKVVLFVLLLTGLVSGTDRQDLAEKADAIAGVVVPHIEEISGMKFTDKPLIKTATPGELAGVLLEEAMHNGSGQDYDIVSAKRTAQGISGKYCYLDKTVRLIPTAIEAASAMIGVDMDEYLRYVVTHELVHALVGVNFEKIGQEASNFEEQDVFAAVSEGYAQYITRNVFRELAYDTYVVDALRIPPAYIDMSPLGTITIDNYYIDGEEFVAGIFKVGGQMLMQKVLANLPKITDYIYDPAEYARIIETDGIKNENKEVPVAEAQSHAAPVGETAEDSYVIYRDIRHQPTEKIQEIIEGYLADGNGIRLENKGYSLIRIRAFLRQYGVGYNAPRDLARFIRACGTRGIVTGDGIEISWIEFMDDKFASEFYKFRVPGNVQLRALSPYSRMLEKKSLNDDSVEAVYALRQMRRSGLFEAFMVIRDGKRIVTVTVSGDSRKSLRKMFSSGNGEGRLPEILKKIGCEIAGSGVFDYKIGKMF